MCDIPATSAHLDATVTVNFKDAEGDFLTFLDQRFSNFFLCTAVTIQNMYTYCCHNTEHVQVLLSQYRTCNVVSQYRTCTHTAVTIQNMYTYHCHNTEHVLLSQYKTYVYYLVLQILIPAFGILSSGMFWWLASLKETCQPGKQGCGNLKFHSFSNWMWLQATEGDMCLYLNSEQ